MVAALEEASLLEKSVANKYTLLLVSSEKLPITLAFLLIDSVPTTLLPKTFSNSPTVLPSDLLINKLIASLYSPSGKIRESRSWFILPFKKVFFISGIF